MHIQQPHYHCMLASHVSRSPTPPGQTDRSLDLLIADLGTSQVIYLQKLSPFHISIPVLFSNCMYSYLTLRTLFSQNISDAQQYHKSVQLSTPIYLKKLSPFDIRIPVLFSNSYLTLRTLFSQNISDLQQYDKPVSTLQHRRSPKK